MRTLRKILRWTKLVILILLALSGAGLGAVLSPRKERDYDNEVKIELVEGDLEDELVSNENETKLF